jgi:hypothetical protein
MALIYKKSKINKMFVRLKYAKLCLYIFVPIPVAHLYVISTNLRIVETNENIIIL